MQKRTYKHWKLTDLRLTAAPNAFYADMGKFEFEVMKILAKCVPSIQFFMGRPLDELDPTSGLS